LGSFFMSGKFTYCPNNQAKPILLRYLIEPILQSNIKKAEKQKTLLAYSI